MIDSITWRYIAVIGILLIFQNTFDWNHDFYFKTHSECSSDSMLTASTPPAQAWPLCSVSPAAAQELH